MVREAHASLEALQVRLKEVRDRLDRVSREEAHYLELATLEHKLLQVRQLEMCIKQVERNACTETVVLGFTVLEIQIV